MKQKQPSIYKFHNHQGRKPKIYIWLPILEVLVQWLLYENNSYVTTSY